MMFFIWRSRFGSVPPVVSYAVRQACDERDKVACLVCPVEDHINERYVGLDCWAYYV